ncbi:MAG: hypothetical protein ALAOOOJD_03542 [bacterium]|nr:hypothetical protein [bacterium]
MSPVKNVTPAVILKGRSRTNLAAIAMSMHTLDNLPGASTKAAAKAATTWKDSSQRNLLWQRIKNYLLCCWELTRRCRAAIATRARRRDHSPGNCFLFFRINAAPPAMPMPTPDNLRNACKKADAKFATRTRVGVKTNLTTTRPASSWWGRIKKWRAANAIRTRARRQRGQR